MAWASKRRKRPIFADGKGGVYARDVLGSQRQVSGVRVFLNVRDRRGLGIANTFASRVRNAKIA